MGGDAKRMGRDRSRQPEGGGGSYFSRWAAAEKIKKPTKIQFQTHPQTRAKDDEAGSLHSIVRRFYWTQVDGQEQPRTGPTPTPQISFIHYGVCIMARTTTELQTVLERPHVGHEDGRCKSYPMLKQMTPYSPQFSLMESYSGRDSSTEKASVWRPDMFDPSPPNRFIKSMGKIMTDWRSSVKARWGKVEFTHTPLRPPATPCDPEHDQADGRMDEKVERTILETHIVEGIEKLFRLEFWSGKGSTEPQDVGQPYFMVELFKHYVV